MNFVSQTLFLLIASVLRPLFSFRYMKDYYLNNLFAQCKLSILDNLFDTKETQTVDWNWVDNTL